jgi:hypothetical protein
VPEEPKARTPRPTFLRTAIVVGVAVAAALGGGMAIAANAPAPRQTTPAPEPANDFVGIQPVRVLDTRNAAGGPIGISPGHKLGAGETIDVAVAGVGAIPTEATSVAINVTIDEDATLKSFLTVWPTGQPRPNTSANNAEPGLVSPNSAIFQLGTGGKLSVFNQQGSVNVIIDVTGYFIAGEFVPTTTSSTTAPAKPAVTTDKTTYATGAAGTFSGTNWTGCTGISVDFVNSATQAKTNVTANATVAAGGAITGPFTAPAPGTYTLVAASVPANPNCQATTGDITVTATLAADSATFTPGQVNATFSGTGWTGCTGVTVDILDATNTAVGSPITGTVTADNLTGTFTAPTPVGAYTLKAHSSPSMPQCEPTSAAFNVS